jgi:hypothetical protein
MSDNVGLGDVPSMLLARRRALAAHGGEVPAKVFHAGKIALTGRPQPDRRSGRVGVWATLRLYNH